MLPACTRSSRFRIQLKREGSPLAEGSLLAPRFYVADTFDEHCAEQLLEACRKVPCFYISDIFYKPVMRWVLRGTTLTNTRPAWKAGAVPKYIQQVLQFGRDGLTWDSGRRAFV
jgi:hypothetical protein